MMLFKRKLNKIQTTRFFTYLAGFFLSIHLSFTAYINSSFLAQIINEELIGAVFSIAAALAIVTLFIIPSILRNFGNVQVITTLTFIVILGLLSLASTPLAWFAVALFIGYYVMGLSIQYSMDLYLEEVSEDKDTGGIRGMFLSVLHIAMMLALITVGFVLGDGDNFQQIYIIAILALLPFWYIAANYFDNITSRYDKLPLKKTIETLWRQPTAKDRNIAKVLAIDFLVNFFYAFMIIYMPIYLHNYIGLPWSTIGWLFAFMLLPFVLFLVPLGKIADNYLGEKEIMSTGLIIVGITCLLIGWYDESLPLAWAGLLFFSRLGVSSVEVMKESFLFKHITPDDANILSISRNTRPLAYIIAPLFASGFLILFDFQYLFVFLGLVMFTGLWFSLRVIDTK